MMAGEKNKTNKQLISVYSRSKRVHLHTRPLRALRNKASCRIQLAELKKNKKRKRKEGAGGRSAHDLG